MDNSGASCVTGDTQAGQQRVRNKTLYRLKENNFLNNFQIIWKRENTQKCSLFQKPLPASWGTNCLHIALHGPLVVLNNARMNKLLVGLTLPEDSGSTL